MGGEPRGLICIAISEQIRSFFEAADVDKSGTVSFQEVLNALTNPSLGVKMSEDAAKEYTFSVSLRRSSQSSSIPDVILFCYVQLGAVMNLTDVNQQLSIDDACIGALTIQTGHELAEAFKANDTDKSGSISEVELVKVLASKAGASEGQAKAEAKKVPAHCSRTQALADLFVL